MTLAHPSLTLTPPWSKDPVIVVGATDALRLCGRGDHEEISVSLAGAYIEDLRRRPLASLREFATRAKFADCRLSQVEDAMLLARLSSAVKRRELRLLRKIDDFGDGADAKDAVQRRLIAAIRAESHGRLVHAGRQYKLVADVDLARIPERDRYEVVRKAEAAEVLSAMASQAGESSPLGKALVQALEGLTRDWRPPLRPEGLVLLRRSLARQYEDKKDDGPITPSQMKALLEDVVEVELVDADDVPVANEAWELLLPDGTVLSGRLDESGYARIGPVPTSGCQIRFPNLDADAWAACN